MQKKQKFYNKDLLTDRFIPMSWDIEINQSQSPKTCKVINKIVDELTKDLSTKGGSKNKRSRIYKVLLSNLAYLISCSSKGKNLTISFSTKPETMQKYKLGRDTVRNCIEQLYKQGFIQIHSGYLKINGSLKYGLNFPSRMKFESKLYKRFYRLEEAVFRKTSKCVVVRDKDENGKKIDVTGNHDIPQELIDEINLINEVNSQAIIKNGEGKVISGGQFYRVFNNSSFHQGGRFYDHVIQSLSSESRKKLTINNESVVEEDYSSLHPKFLYDLEKIPQCENFDAYRIDDDSLIPIPKAVRRKFLKLAVNIMLNASSLEEAQYAIIDKVSKVGKKSKKKPLLTKEIVQQIDMDKVCNAILNYHSPIKRHFYGGEGIVLQNLDSDIASRILYMFAKAGEPCLCVHDSFIVRQSVKQDLNKAMQLAYQYVLQDNM